MYQNLERFQKHCQFDALNLDFEDVHQVFKSFLFVKINIFHKCSMFLHVSKYVLQILHYLISMDLPLVVVYSWTI